MNIFGHLSSEQIYTILKEAPEKFDVEMKSIPKFDTCGDVNIRSLMKTKVGHKYKRLTDLSLNRIRNIYEIGGEASYQQETYQSLMPCKAAIWVNFYFEAGEGREVKLYNLAERTVDTFRSITAARQYLQQEFP